MRKIIPFIVLLTINLAAFLYCISEFILTGSSVTAPDANIEQLGMQAWLWGGGTLLFFVLTAYLGWRIVMIIRPD